MLKRRFTKSITNSFASILSKIVCVFILITTAPSFAKIYFGDTGRPATLNDVFARISPSTAILISENHGHEPHHQNQRDLLVQLSGASFPISVGMEFFYYTDQALIDDYVHMRVSESDFLNAIGWNGVPFSHYRFQVRFPFFRGGSTVGINLPRSITGKVSQYGLDSLTPDEAKLLPPNFQLGNEEYFERFYEVMKDHVPDGKALENYFTAHSLWDETMAWRASEFLKQNPDHVLVIIVGDFHVAYEDGLVESLQRRNIRTLAISQILNAAEIAPHPRYGRRGDFVWLPE